MHGAHPETKVRIPGCRKSLAVTFISLVEIKMFVLSLFFVSVGWTERSALRALREQLFVHKSDLISAFQEFDPHNTGTKATPRRSRVTTV